jgi:hypothetical protein
VQLFEHAFLASRTPSHADDMSQPNNAQDGAKNRKNTLSSGWFLSKRPDLPKIALPGPNYSEKAGFQKVFLATHDTLHDSIFAIVMGSATIKAWFAMISPELKRTSTSAKGLVGPLYGPIWELIKKQKATWSENFGRDGYPATQWELHEPSSLGELYALAMFAIYRNVLDNPEKDDEGVAGLKWCKYYDEDEEQFFLLYRFLLFMGPYCTGAGAIRFDRPPVYAGSRAMWTWNKTRGATMHAAVRQFLTGE